ncbi:hypothetical protein ACJMK2_022675 [Sinanodonta woodiana]|uniref:TRPM SLOG domain-containing protein n=1 Tax=Sinanodonta woodiana TaxID=1069815 RepID=A0ABD3TJR0_SINWO
MASNGRADTSLSMSQTEGHNEDTEKTHEPNKLIIQNINMRKCSYYIASTEAQSEGMCKCGYRKGDHDENAIDLPKQEQPQQDLNWNFEQHSTTKPTNAFGEIEFVGFNGNNAKFIRADSKTKIEHLLMMMKNVWKIQKPDILISVIGGEENFNLTPRLRELLQSGLLNIARDTAAWIVTGGTNIGVAKHVGEAVKYSRLQFNDKNNIVAIGIAPWGCIHNKQLLEEIKQKEPIKYTIGVKPNEHERYLNPHHSHYILVDNGTQHQFETETTLRAEFECIKSCREYDIDSLPVVLLVVDGGPRILKTVRNSLSNDIPVVIVKGSGRVADLLAYAFESAEEFEFTDTDKGHAIRKTAKRLTNSHRHYIYNKMRSANICEKSKIDTYINQIEACLDKFELITVFELGSCDQDLNNTLLQAIIKATNVDLVEQVKRALHFNLIDYARSDILTADKSWKPGSLDDIMVAAIRSNRVDFVELLLINGVDIKTFLTIKRLLELYNDVSL